MKYMPNILLAVALFLTIIDLIWPTPKLVDVAVLLVIVSLIAQPVVKVLP